MDAVLVAKRQIVQQIFERVDAPLRQQFRALRPHSLHHANFCLEAYTHLSFFISSSVQAPPFVKLAYQPHVSIEWASEATSSAGGFLGRCTAYGRRQARPISVGYLRPLRRLLRASLLFPRLSRSFGGFQGFAPHRAAARKAVC